MDDLRYKICHQSKFSDLLSLPLTSADLYLHFLRYMHTTCIQTHCLHNVTVDPTKYDYEDKNGSLFVPIIYTMSQRGLYKIQLKLCSNKHCARRSIDVPCCVNCKCKNNISGHASACGFSGFRTIIKYLFVLRLFTTIQTMQ